MTRLECRDDEHDKFWEGSVAGAVFTVRFGRIGTAGQVKAKKLANAEAAKNELEKVIRDKLAHGYVRAAGKEASPKKAPPPASAKKKTAKSDALLALAELLGPKSAKVAKQVALACKDPAAYKVKYAEALEDRNAEDDPVDPWLALVSALTGDDVELGCPLDWKDSAEDIQGNLERVIAAQAKLRKNPKLYDKKKLFAFYDEDAYLHTKTLDFIQLCGRAFSAHGLALVELDIASDSYELIFIPWKELSRAQDLAKKAGGKLVLHAPTKPLTTALPKPAPKATSNVKLQKLKFGWLVQADDFIQNPGFLHWKDSETAAATTLIDCSTWPPKKTLIGKGRLDVIVHEGDGSKILHRVSYDEVDDVVAKRPTGTLRIERPKKRPVDLLDELPDNFSIEKASWIGDLAVFFPADDTVREKKSRRPLVWNGKTLAPAKGLPDATPKKGTKENRWPSFLRCGHARTGTGVDVLIWEGAGWIAKGDTFVKTWKLEPDPTVWDWGPIIGAPAPGNGFFYSARSNDKKNHIATIRHAENGKCTERFHLDEVIDGPLRTVMDGRVLFGLNRYGNSKKAVLCVFHPESNELTFVPSQVLGFRKDDQVEAYGVSPEKKGGAFLWVLDDEELRRVSWDAILALPRKPVPT